MLGPLPRLLEPQLLQELAALGPYCGKETTPSCLLTAVSCLTHQTGGPASLVWVCLGGLE